MTTEARNSGNSASVAAELKAVRGSMNHKIMEIVQPIMKDILFSKIHGENNGEQTDLELSLVKN